MAQIGEGNPTHSFTHHPLNRNQGYLYRTVYTNPLRGKVRLYFDGGRAAGLLSMGVANFVYAFGIWDLAYYAALWLVEGWPASLCDWDLLFVIPVPWFAPVLAPIAISCTEIIGAGYVLTWCRNLRSW